MGCSYEKFSGECELFDSDIENPGCDDEGNCICSSDEDPSHLCEEYEEN